VASATFTQRRKISSRVEVEELIEATLYTEHKTTKKGLDEISSNFAQFTEKFGLKAPAAKGKKTTSKATFQPGDVLSALHPKLTTPQQTAEVAQRRQDLALSNRLEAEVRRALQDLAVLRETISGPESVISNITEESLRSSRALRTSLKEYKEFYFLLHNKDNKYLKKEYTSKEQRETDAFQTIQQSNFMKDVQKYSKVAEKNNDLMKEVM
jgi:hypothetical protein